MIYWEWEALSVQAVSHHIFTAIILMQPTIIVTTMFGSILDGRKSLGQNKVNFIFF